jgi:hypothetical protein
MAGEKKCGDLTWRKETSEENWTETQLREKLWHLSSEEFMKIRDGL